MCLLMLFCVLLNCHGHDFGTRDAGGNLGRAVGVSDFPDYIVAGITSQSTADRKAAGLLHNRCEDAPPRDHTTCKLLRNILGIVL